MADTPAPAHAIPAAGARRRVSLRAVVLPLTGVMLLLGWGLSGVALVPMDQRAVYERLGTPVAVLQPGLHLGLPWPMGAIRPVEFGPVHDISLLPAPVVPAPAAAGAPALATTDSGQSVAVALLTATDAPQGKGYQSVSADLRVLYRTGLDDASAIRAATTTADPDALMRAAAGRAVTDYFAVRSWDMALAADRDAAAATLCTRLQAELDRFGSGLEVMAVVIGAIEPPAGTAQAYQHVRAAEIAAGAGIAVARGAAAANAAQSRQHAYEIGSAARATAYETVSAARTGLVRFTADQQAARAGGASFRLERYFAALDKALARAPKTIIDHRLNWPEAPMLDLRPLAAASAATGGKEE